MIDNFLNAFDHFLHRDFDLLMVVFAGALFLFVVALLWAYAGDMLGTLE